MNGIQARPDLDPDRLELGEALRHAVHQPVRHVQHVAPGEAEPVHRDEAVGELQALVGPGEGGVEAERQVPLLQRRVHLHVRVLVVAGVVRRRHHEADDAFALAELLDDLVAGLGIVERQIQHRLDARLLVEDGVAEPAVVGAREPDLDLVARTVREIEHRRREHDRDVDAELVHPALHQHDVAMRRRRHLLVLALRIAGDAAGELLVGAGLRRDAAARRALELRLVAQHRVLDELRDLLERLGLVVMRVDVDDEEVLVAALDRLLGGVLQQRAGVEPSAERSRKLRVCSFMTIPLVLARSYRFHRCFRPRRKSRRRAARRRISSAAAAGR